MGFGSSCVSNIDVIIAAADDIIIIWWSVPISEFYPIYVLNWNTQHILYRFYAVYCYFLVQDY